MTDFKSDNFYQVLARKYRPRSFKDLRGQSQLVKTLQNAIFSGRIPHAILLVGERGIGKTTAARIIAQALNCQQMDRTSPETIDPCLKCSACQSIQDGTQIDLIEMDAASHSGVENIRPIVQGNMYKPVKLTFKVFIIDEVHMLTKYAFNALLKTLEEPAPHLKFIFATTEATRIPDTIVSRCMRFELNPFSMTDLRDLVNAICVNENITIDNGACSLLAYSANGSARDALSLLDQAINYLGSSIQLDNLRAMMGYAHQQDIIRFIVALSRHETAFITDQYLQYVSRGTNPINFLKEVHHILYVMVLIKVNHSAVECNLIDPIHLEALKQLSHNMTQPTLMRLWQSLSRGLEDLKYCSSLPEAGLMILLKLCYLSELPDVAQLIDFSQHQALISNVVGQLGPPSLSTSIPTSMPISVAQPNLNMLDLNHPDLLTPSPPQLNDKQVPSSDAPENFGPIISPKEKPTSAPIDHVPTAPEQPMAVHSTHTNDSHPLDTVDKILDLCAQHKESLLSCRIEKDMIIHHIDSTQQCITISLLDKAPKKLAITLKEFLSTATKKPWKVMIQNHNADQHSHYDAKKRQQALLHEQISAHPDAINIMAKFPGAKITTIRKI